MNKQRIIQYRKVGSTVNTTYFINNNLPLLAKENRIRTVTNNTGQQGCKIAIIQSLASLPLALPYVM